MTGGEAPEPTTPGSPAPAPGGGGGASPTSAPEQPVNLPGGSPGITPTEPAAPQATQTGAQPTPITATQSDCLNQGVFVGDITIPDGTLLRPGEKFTKIWRVKNTGTCDWGAGYTLAFHSGDIMNAEFNPPIDAIRAGAIGDVSVELTSPTRGGMQVGNWVFQNGVGERFGLGFTGSDVMWVQINVTFLDEAGTPTGFQPAPATQEAPAAGGAPANPPAESPGEVESGSESLFANCRYTQNQAFISELLRLINDERRRNGLGTVFLQDQLSAAALKHSADMACNRFVDHNGSDGSTWYDRVRAQGYAAPNSARENIYVGDPQFGGDAAGAFAWWMNSPVHRDNILFPTVTEIGLGYVYLAGSPQGGYYTLVLARR